MNYVENLMKASRDFAEGTYMAWECYLPGRGVVAIERIGRAPITTTIGLPSAFSTRRS